MTHLRHWLCTAPIVSVPIKVPVSADAILSSELGNRYAAREFITLVGGHRGGLPACGARAAAGEKPQGRTAPSGGVYESTLKAIRWRAAWVSPLSRNFMRGEVMKIVVIGGTGLVGSKGGEEVKE